MILLKERLWPYFQINNTLGNPELARFYLAAQTQALSEFSGFGVHTRHLGLLIKDTLLLKLPSIL